MDWKERIRKIQPEGKSPLEELVEGKMPGGDPFWMKEPKETWHGSDCVVVGWSATPKWLGVPVVKNIRSGDVYPLYLN